MYIGFSDSNFSLIENIDRDRIVNHVIVPDIDLKYEIIYLIKKSEIVILLHVYTTIYVAVLISYKKTSQKVLEREEMKKKKVTCLALQVNSHVP